MEKYRNFKNKLISIVKFRKMLNLLMTFYLFFYSFSVLAQPAYDACSNALMLCPNEVFSVNNIGATHTSYNFGEDDFNFCFIPRKTIWLKFETNNNGGTANILLNGLNFNTSAGSGVNFILVKPAYPCDGTTYANDTCVTTIQSNYLIQVDSLDSLSTYYICLSGTDVSGTISEFTLDITISGQAVNRVQPTLSVLPSKTVLCAHEEIALSAYLNDCPDAGKYRWYRNGQLFAVSDDDYIFTSQISDGDVFAVENNCFQYCIDTLRGYTQALTVKTIDIQVSGDTAVNYGKNAILQCYTAVDSILWEPGYFVQNVDSVYTFAFPNETTTFYANAWISGCKISKPIVVEVSEDLKIFNTFSPNGDGINDTWVIPGIEKFPDCEIAVFTRWGQRVFFSIGYTEGNRWNGTHNGKKLEAGTYFYTIDLKDSAFPDLIKGAINLIR